MSKKHSKTKQISFAVLWPIGVGLCMVLLLISASLTGYLLINEIIGISSSVTLARVFLFISIFISILAILFTNDLPAAPISLAISGTMILIQLFACAFTEEGITGSAILNSVILLSGAGLSMAIKLKIKPKSRHSKKAYC